MKSRRPLADRFWEKVQVTDGCWEWQAARTYGYGRIGAGGDKGPALLAHRVSWELHFGPIPAEMNVLHACDNPPCVNPGHLFLGSHADNVADKVRKGRGADRERHGMARLTSAQVREIRSAAGDGQLLRVIAERYGLTESAVSMIARGLRWRAA